MKFKKIILMCLMLISMTFCLTACGTPSVEDAISKSSDYLSNITSFNMDVDLEMDSSTSGDNNISSGLNIKYNGKMIGAEKVVNLNGKTTVELFGYNQSQDTDYYIVLNDDGTTSTYAQRGEVWTKTNMEKTTFSFDSIKNLGKNLDTEIFNKISTIEKKDGNYVITSDFKKLSKEDAKKIFNNIDIASTTDANTIMVGEGTSFSDYDLSTFNDFTVIITLDKKTYQPKEIDIKIDGTTIEAENSKQTIYIKANIKCNDFNNNDDLSVPEDAIQNAVEQNAADVYDEDNISYDSEETVYDDEGNVVNDASTTDAKTTE